MGEAVAGRPPGGGPDASRRALWFAALGLALVVVCIPRFNRQDLGFIDRYTTEGNPAIEHLGDAGEYMTHVQWFRGEVPGEALLAPFSYRPLVPWLASWLPFDALTSINVVDLLAMFATVLLIARLLGVLGFSSRWQALGGAMFVFSFPVFYYGPIGLVDPMLVCMIALATLLTYHERWLAVAAVVLVGTLARETMCVFLPVVGMRMLLKWGISWRVFLASAAYAGVWIGGAAVGRALSPTMATFAWETGFDLLMQAWSNPRNIASAVLSFGVPGFVALAMLFRIRRLPRETLLEYAPLMAGLATVLTLYVYASMVGVVDGRHLWDSYPMTIPMALYALRGWVEARAPARVTAPA